MPAKIVECVPNFSEGRDAAKIKAITDAIAGRAGRNALARRSRPRRQPHGRHLHRLAGSGRRGGVSGHRQGGRADRHARARTASIPAWARPTSAPSCPSRASRWTSAPRSPARSAAASATSLASASTSTRPPPTDPKRKNLADIRRGEYEGLEEKLKHDFWQPDCGPAVFNPRSGATVIGAREFLIAYNINLNTRDKSAAAAIAAQLRESGRAGQPGEFKFCKAIGWYVEEYGRAQISMNLTNYRVTPPHVVLERARQLAAARGLAVTGSELVGMIPYAALLEAGKFYLAQQGRSADIPIADILETAVAAMGLRDVRPFDVHSESHRPAGETRRRTDFNPFRACLAAPRTECKLPLLRRSKPAHHRKSQIAAQPVPSLISIRNRPGEMPCRAISARPPDARRRIGQATSVVVLAIGNSRQSSCGNTQRRSANVASTSPACDDTRMAACCVGRSTRWSNSARIVFKASRTARKSTTHWQSSSGPNTSAATW